MELLSFSLLFSEVRGMGRKIRVLDFVRILLQRRVGSHLKSVVFLQCPKSRRDGEIAVREASMRAEKVRRNVGHSVGRRWSGPAMVRSVPPN
jgi:hypothetical protein